MNCVAPNCDWRADELHHVVYAQEVRRRKGDPLDERNLIPVCRTHHSLHHGRSAPLPLWVLPDSVFDFARELTSIGAASMSSNRTPLATKLTERVAQWWRGRRGEPTYRQAVDDAEAVAQQRDELRAHLGRIRAAAKSDADLQQLPALRDFLLTETMPAAVPFGFIGLVPEADDEGLSDA